MTRIISRNYFIKPAPENTTLPTQILEELKTAPKVEVMPEKDWFRNYIHILAQSLNERGIHTDCDLMYEQPDPTGFTTRLHIHLLAEKYVPIRVAREDQAGEAEMSLLSWLNHLKVPTGILIMPLRWPPYSKVIERSGR